MTPTITPHQFVDKWDHSGFTEQQGAQSFFNDLCGLVGHATPTEFSNPEVFTFEKQVPGGGKADAYLEGHFVWEFKSHDSQLEQALVQAVGYSRHLKNPPLIIVSSFNTVRIETNFQGMELVRHDIALPDLVQQEKLELLRRVFHSPDALRPDRSVADVTTATARLFSNIVADMEGETEDQEALARHLNRIIFCLYAEDSGLLPEGLFTSIMYDNRERPDLCNQAITGLFEKMAGGGMFGAKEIAWFNGDLFRADTPIELSPVALQRLGEACAQNWRSIEPSIFGTLFERALDASKRAQTGAHYTGADDIELVVEPVVMTPLRREWETARAEIEELLEGAEPSEAGFSGLADFQDGVADAPITQSGQSGLSESGFSGLEDLQDYGRQSGQSVNPVNPDSDNPPARARLEAFRERLASVRVLDPACGSGNFLYIALRSLLDLEREVIDFAAVQGWHGLTPRVQPDQMLGLEINHYAAELARTALWIGYIQWHQANGFPYTQRPILTPLDTIRQTDAILDLSDPDHPSEPEWPAAEFIVGNPPFLGGKLLRTGLSDEYVDAMFKQYAGKVPAEADLVCYWFNKAQRAIEAGAVKRAGLLATQGIRGGANRRVLQRIKETGDIFMAWSDRPWVLEGAAVRISIVAFDDGSQWDRELNGRTVQSINSSLSIGADLTAAERLEDNLRIAFMGDTKGGPFDIPAALAQRMLDSPNPHGKGNSDVVKPWVNGSDIVKRNRGMWIIDFGGMGIEDAALYEVPFEYVNEWVRPQKEKSKSTAHGWWLHERPRPEMREALKGLNRYIVTPTAAKHRLFVWLTWDVIPDHQLIAVARNDDYTFGVLHSKFHEVWALVRGTHLGVTPRYTPTTCFETFPFPRPTEEQREAIGAIAAELNRLREGWLNPEGVSAAELKKRTLTNLYNQRPTWLDNVHARLDAAVADAYGWPADLADGDILERLLALNLERAGEG